MGYSWKLIIILMILGIIRSATMSTHNRTFKHLHHRHHHHCKVSDDETISICSHLRFENLQGIPQTVEKLTIKNSTGSITNTSFSNVPSNLTFLSITHSHVEEISGLFKMLPKVHFFVLLNNFELPNITKEVFRDADNLQWLSILSNNLTISQDDAFQHLFNLTWLHVQNEHFPVLNGNFLMNNSRLHELTITNCSLEDVAPDSFDNCPELELLSLNFNKIRYFHKGTFKNLHKLRIMELHHNHFTNVKFLEHFEVGYFSSLEVVGLPSNLLRHIGGVEELLQVFPNLNKIEIKKKDLYNNSDTANLIQDIKKSEVHIIGTPHDCHLPPKFFCHKRHKIVQK